MVKVLAAKPGFHPSDLGSGRRELTLAGGFLAYRGHGTRLLAHTTHRENKLKRKSSNKRHVHFLIDLVIQPVFTY